MMCIRAYPLFFGWVDRGGGPDKKASQHRRIAMYMRGETWLSKDRPGNG